MNIVKFMLVISMLFSFPVYDIPLDYQLQKVVYQECKKYDIGYELGLAVMYVESGFNVNAVNKQSKGLMQLNSDTYPWIAEELKIDNFDPYNAEHNIKAGIFYLGYLRDYWNNKGYSDESVFGLMLISYNKGIRGCQEYVNKYGLNNTYINKVFEYKSYLEQTGAMRKGDLKNNPEYKNNI